MGGRNADAGRAGGLETDSIMAGACRVTGASHLIERGSESIRVEARTMQLLLCLAEHPGEVVHREANEARLWPRGWSGTTR